MKRCIAIMLVALLMFCFVGCGEDDQNVKSEVYMELIEEELVAAASKNLSVPDNENITYEIGEKQLWEDADIYFKNIAFFENGKKVASADVNPANGQPLKNVFYYNE